MHNVRVIAINEHDEVTFTTRVDIPGSAGATIAEALQKAGVSAADAEVRVDDYPPQMKLLDRLFGNETVVVRKRKKV